MKLVGAVLILISGAALGLQVAARRRARAETLRELCASLEQACAELEAANLPLPALLERLAKQSGEASAGFFRHLCAGLAPAGETSFQELWETAVHEELKQLRERERQDLLRLGTVLGRYDLDSQLEAIRLCRASLGAEWESIRMNDPAERRLLLGLTAAGAGLLVVILI